MPPCQGGGCEFESRFSLQFYLKYEINLYMRVSYIGNTLAFQASKVGSIPTTRSNKQLLAVVFFIYKLIYALVVQLDRALDFESRSREFESHQVHHMLVIPTVYRNLNRWYFSFSHTFPTLESIK